MAILNEPPFLDSLTDDDDIWALSWTEWLRDVQSTVNERYAITGAENDYTRITATGSLEGRSYSEVKSDLSLDNVENTAHSTDAHTMTIDGRDVSADGAKLDNLYDTIGLKDLTAAEVNQLENIDATTISATQWGYLGSATAAGGAVLDAANDAAILALLSGDATASFSWNSQDLTSVGLISCTGITIPSVGRFYIDGGSNTFITEETGADVMSFYTGNNLSFNLAQTTAAMTGTLTVANLATAGTVDGRDVSADGTKLDSMYLSTALSALVDIRTYGATTGSGNNKAEIDAAIADCPAGGTVYIPEGTWKITDTLAAINKAITIRGGGYTSKIEQETTAKGVFEITAGSVQIKDLRLFGFDAPNTAVVGADAIYAHGDISNRTYIDGLRITNVFFENWERYGAFIYYVNGLLVSQCDMASLTYAGIGGLSVRNGRIHHNYINDIKCHDGNLNGYGILLTRATPPGGNPEEDVSRDILVDHNIIRNVATWEGLDTHSGKNITFDSNQVYDCQYGIVVTDSSAGGVHRAGDNVVVSNNIIDSEVDDGSHVTGIEFASGDSANYATGTITGNIITYHGSEDTDPRTATPPSGGIVAYITKGLVVSNNLVINPSPVGIHFDQHNIGFSCSGNVIKNPWSTTDVGGVVGIWVGGNSGQSNVGYIGGNSIELETLGKNHEIDDGDGEGIFIKDAANNDIILGSNHSEAATYLVDIGGKSIEHYIMRTQNLAIYSNVIEEHLTNTDAGAVAINYAGYQGGVSKFRDTHIYNGKQASVAFFDGSEKKTTLYGDLIIPPLNKFYLDGGTHTYIYESGADVMDFYTGATRALALTPTTAFVYGLFDFRGAMGASNRNPKDDDPQDWVEIKIAGTTYYIPVYSLN